MPVTISHILLTALILCLIVFNLILNKRFSFFSSFFFVFSAIVYVMKTVDNEAYEIYARRLPFDAMILVLALASLGVVIAIIEICYGSLKKKEKKEVLPEPEPTVSEMPQAVAKEEKTQDATSQQDALYFNSINTPLAYLTGDVYLLNTAMMKVLGVSANQLKKGELVKFINDDDSYQAKAAKSVFRFKSDDKQWYQENVWHQDKTEYRIIHEQKNPQQEKGGYKSFDDLYFALSYLESKKKDYSLAFIDLKNIRQISSVFGKNMAGFIGEYYLHHILEFPYIKSENIYHVFLDEYALLFDDEQDYASFIADLTGENPALLKMPFSYEKKSLTIMVKAGIVERKTVKQEGIKAVIEKGMQTLKLACSENYPAMFAIYSPLDDELDYSLSDLNIDLNLDLDVYKKKLK